MVQMDKMDVIIKELQEVKLGQAGFKEQLNQIDKKVDGNTERLEIHTTILNKHSDQLDSHTEILNKHSGQLDTHTEKLDSHTEILGIHTERLDNHTSLLQRIGTDITEIKNRVNRSEHEGPQDILGLLKIIESKVEPINKIEKRLNKIDSSLEQIEEQNNNREPEIKVLNNRMFRLESKVEQLTGE